MALTVTCTPNEALDVVPCLRCLSDTQLMAVLAILLCRINGGARADCEATDLATSAKCWCISDHQKLQVVVSWFFVLAIELGAFDSVETFSQTVSNVQNLPPDTVRGAILRETCTYLAGQVAIAQQ